MAYKDIAKGEAVFKALGEGGQVTMPFAPPFLGKGFGMLVDRFGVHWMVNCEDSLHAYRSRKRGTRPLLRRCSAQPLGAGNYFSDE